MRKWRISFFILLANLLLLSKRGLDLALVGLKKALEASLSYQTKLFLGPYSYWLRLKKLGHNLARTTRDDKKIFYIFSRPALIYALVIILSILAITESSVASSARGGNFSQSSTLASMNSENSEGFVIEEGFPPLHQSSLPLGIEAKDGLPESEGDMPAALAVLDGTALIKPNIIDQARPRTRTEIEEYIVQPGDNISTIAQKFGISINTILWANKLSYQSLIRIDKKLMIPPVTGIIHQIKRGDTVASLAKLYKADTENIIDFNKLADGEDIRVGEKLVIPGGRMPYQAPERTKPVVHARLATTEVGKESHKFPYGYCTWYVAQKRIIPWAGHAKHWIANARKYGYSIGTEPAVGAIIVTRESWYGHVAYVEKVEGDSVTFSEMNHRGNGGGWGKESWRTLNQNDRKIIGYIY